MRRVTAPILPSLIPAPKPTTFWTEPFDALNPVRWREVEVKHHTVYQSVALEGRQCLQAQSQASASILLTPLQFDPDIYEWLSWSWRVDQFVEGEALERKAGSDAAARVYVYFKTRGLPWQKRSLDYVWSASLPVGTILSSAFSSTAKIIVVESGTSSLGRWRTVQRNLGEDYRRCFGEDPPDVVALGLMSDTDNTGAQARAFFDDLRVSRTPDGSILTPVP